MAGYWFSRTTGSAPVSETPQVRMGEATQPSVTDPVNSEQESEAVLPEDKAKLDTLAQILASRNDNDPRMDTELKVLSPVAKRLMMQRYHAFEPEKRNERGTIVFLLGRNLQTEADFGFFCDVLREPPCVSLNNCASDPATMGREDFDRESGEEVTLAYPQLMALKALQAFLERGGQDAGAIAQAWKAIECARDSRVGVVIEKADELISKH